MAATNDVRQEFSLGRLIAIAREEAGMDQLELADRVGCSRTTISRWEHNKGAPTVPEFNLIIQATGASWLGRFAISSYLTAVDLTGVQTQFDFDSHRPRLFDIGSREAC